MQNPIRVLVWDSDEGPMYYDVSTNELLQAAALKILQHRMDSGLYFSPPRELEKDVSYSSHKKKIETFKLAFGDCEEEAFEDVKSKIEYFEGVIGRKEQRYKQSKEEWDKIVNILDSNDGAAAVMLLIDRQEYHGEEFKVIEPERCVLPEKINAKA